MENCKAEDFYKASHGYIFEAITSLYGRGEPADWVTVTEELRRRELLESIGDTSVFVSLQANTPSIGNAEYYAKIVEELALLRRLVGVAGEISELGYSVPEDVSEVLDRAESLVFDVAQRRVVDTMTPLEELLGATLDHLEHLFSRSETVTGLATGYTDLDEQLAGLQPSNLVVVGARPGHGQDGIRPGHGGPRRGEAEEAGPPVLPGDEPHGAHPAAAVLRVPGRRRPDADRQAARGRLAEDRQRHQPDERGPDLHRRQPEPHGHGHPGPGPSAQEP